MSKQLILAIILQLAIFGLFQFVDARMATMPSFRPAFKLALNPAFIALYMGSCLGLWWSYRAMVEAMNGRYFASLAVLGPLLGAERLLMAYLGSRQVPTIREAIALALGITGAIIVAGRWK